MLGQQIARATDSASRRLILSNISGVVFSLISARFVVFMNVHTQGDAALRLLILGNKVQNCTFSFIVSPSTVPNCSVAAELISVRVLSLNLVQWFKENADLSPIEHQQEENGRKIKQRREQ